MLAVLDFGQIRRDARLAAVVRPVRVRPVVLGLVPVGRGAVVVFCYGRGVAAVEDRGWCVWVTGPVGVLRGEGIERGVREGEVVWVEAGVGQRWERGEVVFDFGVIA